MENELTERILIVDDVQANRRLLARVLAVTGIELAECESGEECLKVCAENPPTLILLDIVMPEIDGIAVCRQLRERYPKDTLPIVLVSSRDTGTDIADGIRAGANDYVTKPIDRTVLLARVENQFNLLRTHRNLERERRRVEESLVIQRTLGDALPDAIAVATDGGRIVYTNAHLHGVELVDAEFTLAGLFDQICEGSLAEENRKINAQVTSNVMATIERECVADGAVARDVQILTGPIRLGDGRLLRFWMWRDVTAIRQLERRAQEQVKLEAVSLFATGVAHNFNNLLGGIGGATSIISRILPKDDRAQRCIRILERAVQQGSKLTRKMMVISGIPQELRTVRLEDVQATLRGVLDVQQSVVGDRVQFSLEMLARVPFVRASTTNLVDVFTSIISNAVDAIPQEGAIKISVDYDRVTDNIVVAVFDNGIGMTPEILSRIYEPFFSTKHLDAANGMSMIGNGLGLWNVYNVMKKLGGRVSVTSTPGVGTTVLLTFPSAGYDHEEAIVHESLRS
jgi:signal transduction histidine kinase